MNPRGDDEPAAEPPQRAEILRDADKKTVLDASLVLSSQGIRHGIEFDGARFSLSLDPDDAAHAREILRLYETENAGFLDTADNDADAAFDLHLSPLLHLAIPIAVFFWLGSVPWHEWLTQRGGADAGRILAGEWWRCLTATTLHAGHEHLLGNLLSGYFILNLLRRRCGPGTSMLLLTLIAGAANFLVAAISSPDHFSLGFSTVVFAALGLLAGAETLHLPRSPLGGLREVSPLLAAFFLAILVGVGEHADVKAHFIGFGLGAALSPLLSRLRWAEKAPWQIGGVVATYGLYAGAWWLAQR